MNHFFKSFLLLLVGFVCIKASEHETLGRDDEEKKYFAMQEEIYEGLEKLGVPGARSLNIDVDLVKSAFVICPNEVKDIIVNIEQGVFFDDTKNIIFYGPSGTGKSALAQAIAIQSKATCLFFNVGTISTTYMNSGVQNLSKIFKHAQELEKKLGKPCIVILDELESLTKKHAGTDNHENNILISFWQELDRLGNNQVVVIGTMNNVEDVPEQIINRTCMIKIPLPSQEGREVIASYHLNKMQLKYKLQYPEWFTADFIAQKTHGFSNRDLRNVVLKALRPAIQAPAVSDGSNRIVTTDHVSSAIHQINKSYREKWLSAIKKYASDPKNIISVAQIGCTALGVYYQREATYQAKILAGAQMAQAMAIADKQMSPEQIAKAAAINTGVNLGAGIVMGAVALAARACCCIQ